MSITDNDTKFDGTNGDTTHPTTIRKLFLCRYLFYLDKKALSKLKILCIGGENIDNQIKKMVKAKKKWNTLWKAVRKGCQKMYNFIKKGAKLKDPNKGKPSKRNTKKYKKWLEIPEENKKVKNYFEEKKKNMKKAFTNFSETLFPSSGGGDEHKIANKIFNFFTTKRLSSSEEEAAADAAVVAASTSSTTSTAAAVTPILPVSLLKQWGLEEKQAELNRAVMGLNTELNVIITHQLVMGGGGKNKNLKFVQSGGYLSMELLKMTLEGIMVGEDDYDNNFSTLYLFLQKMYEIAASDEEEDKDDEDDETTKQDGEDDDNYEQRMGDMIKTIENKLYITLTKMKINSDCFYESLIEDIYENIQGEIRFVDIIDGPQSTSFTTENAQQTASATPTKQSSSETKTSSPSRTVRKRPKQPTKAFEINEDSGDKLKNWDMNLTIENIKVFNKQFSENIKEDDYFAPYYGTLYEDYSGPSKKNVPDFFKFQINGDDV